MQQVPGKALSTEMDLGRVLRWIGIASAAVKKTDYTASGGIHSAKGVIKTILAGATAVEICSTIYKNTSNVIAEYLQEMKCWMKRFDRESSRFISAEMLEVLNAECQELKINNNRR